MSTGVSVQTHSSPQNQLSLPLRCLALNPPALLTFEFPLATPCEASIKEAFAYFAARSGFTGMLPEWVPTPSHVRFGEAVARLDRAVYGLIADRRWWV
jgi:hypothetical protein